jgi:hypothetical protein
MHGTPGVIAHVAGTTAGHSRNLGAKVGAG